MEKLTIPHDKRRIVLMLLVAVVGVASMVTFIALLARGFLAY